MKTDLSRSVGRYLHRKRLDAHVSLRSLAKRSRIPSTTLEEIERGDVRPSIAVMARVARALGVAMTDLVRDAVASEHEPRPAEDPKVVLAQIGKLVTELPERVGDKLDVAEQAVVRYAMSVTGENKSAAARLLGIERKAMDRRWERIQRTGRRASRRG